MTNLAGVDELVLEKRSIDAQVLFKNHGTSFYLQTCCVS